MNKDGEPEFGLRRETGERYIILDRKERILVLEVLKLTRATEAGKEFLI